MNQLLPMPWGDCQVFSPCWCSVAGRENNPNCKQKVSIESWVFSGIIVIAISIFILNKLKIINMRTLFNKLSTFLWGEKPFRWGELKGL